MRKSFIIAVLFCSHGAMAQISNINLNGAPARLSSYTEVDGSPYLFEDWSRADIGTTNAGVKENVAFRFNVHDNELEVINEAGNNIFLNKDYLEYAMLERPPILLATGAPGMLPKLLVKKGFEFIPGIGPKDLVNVIAEGTKYTLIRKFYTDLVTPPKNTYAPTPGRMFVYEETFYLIDSNEKVETVRARTNNILKSLKDSDKELAKSIIKENKLDLSREDHLVIFFRKLNSV